MATLKEKAIAKGYYIGVQDSEDDVQRRLACSRFMMRAFGAFIAFFLLPLHVILPIYSALLEYDERAAAFDYRAFRGPLFCNSLWCASPRSSADAMLRLVTLVPTAFLFVIGHVTFARLVRRRYDKYYASKRARMAAIEEEVFKAIREPPYRRLERARDARRKYREAVRQELLAHRPRHVRIGCPMALVHRVRALGHPGRARCLRGRKVKAELLGTVGAVIFLIVLPVCVFIPLLGHGTIRVDLSVSGPVAWARTIWALRVVVPCLACLGALRALLRRLAPVFRALRLRVRRMYLGDDGDLAVEAPPDEAEIEAARLMRARFFSTQRARAAKFSLSTRLGIWLARMGVTKWVVRWAIFLYGAVALPINVLAPAIAPLESIFPGFQVTAGTSQRLMLVGMLASGVLCAVAIGIRASLRRRRPLRRRFKPGHTLEEAMVRMSRKLGVPLEELEEYPLFSVGHVLVTTGLRPRGMPYLHRGHRFNYRAIPAVLLVLVVGPLLTLLPFQQHAPSTLRDLDEAMRFPSGTTSWMLLSVALSLPAATLATFVGMLLWGVVPAAVRAAMPTAAAWFVAMGVIPGAMGLLLRNATDLGGPLLQLSGLLLAFPASFALLALVRARTVLGALWRWVHSLRVDAKYHDIIARTGIYVSSLAVLVLPAWTILGFVILVAWNSVYSEFLIYSYAMIIIITSSIAVVFLIWGFAAARFFDFIPPFFGPYRVRPVLFMGIMIGCGSAALRSIATYRPGTGGLDEGESFAHVRWIFSLCVAASLLAYPALAQVLRRYSRRKRFGYHPEHWELFNPILSRRPWEVTAELQNHEHDDYFDSEDDEVDEARYIGDVRDHVFSDDDVGVSAEKDTHKSS